MLREIINRKITPQITINEEDNFFPISYINTVNARQTSTSFRAITFRNFAYLDTQTNKLYLNFDALEDYRTDQLNFVSVIGCDINHPKQGLIDISEEPILIINGIQYFLLRAQACTVDILKILYTICDEIYVGQRLLVELDKNLSRAVDVTQTWQIKNYLSIVTKHSFENESQLKTTAQSKSINQYFEKYEKLSEGIKEQSSLIIFSNLQNYFTKISFVNQSCISQYDPIAIKQHLQANYDIDGTRWYVYESLLQGCTKMLVGSKMLAMKQFHKINAQIILNQLEKDCLNNFQIFIFEVMRIYNQQNNKFNKQKQIKQKQSIQRQMQKQRAKFKQIKKNLLEPFLQAESSWLGRTENYKEKYRQIKQKIQNQHEQILLSSFDRDENILFQQIDKLISQQNGLQSLGNPKFDNLHIKYSHYAKKMIGNLQKIIKSKIKNKKRLLTQNNNNNLLINYQNRIQINQKKKQSLQLAIQLALKEQEYLWEIKRVLKPLTRGIHPLQITKQ